MSVDQTHLDVLQNIEFGIMEVYRAEPSLLDMDVKDAVDALVRQYHAEEEERHPPALHLSDPAQRVFESVQPLCEWRLGRSAPLDGTEAPESPLPVSELVECLRKILKSVQRWSRQGGHQGYLKFIQQYIT